jgi:phosphatidate cytidylyltransferase
MPESADPGPSDADESAPLRRTDARRAAEPDSAFQAHVRTARSEFEHQIERAKADFEQANERINARTGRNLLLAIAIGVSLGAVVIGTLLFVKWFFLLFALPVCALGVFEFSRALQAAGRRVDVVPQLIAAVAIPLSAAFLDSATHWVITFAAITALIVWRLIAQMAAADGRRYGAVVSDVLTAGFIQVYVVFLASLILVLLRQDAGEWWVLAMLIVVVAADTGAYAAGLAFGRHPMAPQISPKKTWEGFAGAVLASLVGAVLIGMLALHLPLWACLVFGVVILVCATIGDLGESMIKRDLGIKDMSSWLPGHGGVLDRLDSILLSGAAALGLYFVLYPLTVSA